MTFWVKKDSTSSGWVQAKSVWVKKNTTDWVPAKSIWVKKDSSTWVQFYPKAGPHTDNSPYFTSDSSGNNIIGNTEINIGTMSGSTYVQKTIYGWVGDWNPNGYTITGFNYSVNGASTSSGSASNVLKTGTIVTKNSTNITGDKTGNTNISIPLDATYDKQFLVLNIDAVATITGSDSSDNPSVLRPIIVKGQPVNVSKSISGTGNVGDTLTYSSSWYGDSSTPTYAGVSIESARTTYKWYSNINGTLTLTDLAGLTSVGSASTYIIQSSDLGKYLYCVETVYNSYTDYHGGTGVSVFANKYLTVKPGTPSITVTNTTTSGFKVTWSSTNAVNYNVQIYNGNNSNYIYGPTTDSITTYTASGLPENTPYTISVYGISSTGTNSDITTMSTRTLITPTITIGASTNDGFNVNLTNYNSAYTWNAYASAGTITKSSNSLYIVTGLTQGSSANVYITSTYNGASKSSSTLTGYSNIPVVSVSHTVNGNSVTFNWSATGATGYDVLVQDDQGTSIYSQSNSTTTTSGSKAMAYGKTFTCTVTAYGHSNSTQASDSYFNPYAPNNPSLSVTSQTASGFSVSVSNYDSSFTYSASTTAGTVSGSAPNYSVSGLSAGQSATVYVNTSKNYYTPGSGSVTGSALNGALAPSLSGATSTVGGFTFTLSNYDSNYSWTASVSQGTSGSTPTITPTSGSSSGQTYTVSGLSSGESATAYVATSRSGYSPGSSSVTGTAAVLSTVTLSLSASGSYGFTATFSATGSPANYGGYATTTIAGGNAISTNPITSPWTPTMNSANSAYGTWTVTITAYNSSGLSIGSATKSITRTAPVGVSPVGVSPVGVSPVGVSPVGVVPSVSPGCGTLKTCPDGTCVCKTCACAF